MANGQFSQYPFVPNQRQFIPPGTTDFASNALLALLLGIKSRAEENRRIQHLGEAQTNIASDKALQALKLQEAMLGIERERAGITRERALTTQTEEQTRQLMALYPTVEKRAGYAAEKERIESEKLADQLQSGIDANNAQIKHNIAVTESVNQDIKFNEEIRVYTKKKIEAELKESADRSSAAAESLRIAKIAAAEAESTKNFRIDAARLMKEKAQTDQQRSEAELIEQQAMTEYNKQLKIAQIAGVKATSESNLAQAAYDRARAALIQSGGITPQLQAQLDRLELAKERQDNIEINADVKDAIKVIMDNAAQGNYDKPPKEGEPSPKELDIRSQLDNLFRLSELRRVNPELVALSFLNGVGSPSTPFASMINDAKKKYLQSQSGGSQVPTQGTSITHPSRDEALVEAMKVYMMPDSDVKQKAIYEFINKWKPIFGNETAALDTIVKTAINAIQKGERPPLPPAPKPPPVSKPPLPKKEQPSRFIRPLGLY